MLLKIQKTILKELLIVIYFRIIHTCMVIFKPIVWKKRKTYFIILNKKIKNTYKITKKNIHYTRIKDINPIHETNLEMYCDLKIMKLSIDPIIFFEVDQ